MNRLKSSRETTNYTYGWICLASSHQLGQVWRKGSNGGRDLHDHMWKSSGLGIHVARILDDLGTHYLHERVLSRTPQSLINRDTSYGSLYKRTGGGKNSGRRGQVILHI